MKTLRFNPCASRTCLWLVRLVFFVFVPPCSPQDFTHRGFVETRILLYPQTSPHDSGQAVADSLLRYEAAYKLSPRLRLSGAFDARTDTHRQTERLWNLSWQDRTPQAPAFAIRHLSATYTRGRLTTQLGKQLIRWGKTDILNPTDRFAPRDFLRVVDNEFLAVTAARLTYGSASNTVDAIFVPRFTPSRIPLLRQRWVVLPKALPPNLQLVDAGAHFPGGPQAGIRWNHIGRTLEYSFSFYEGFNHLPVLDPTLLSLSPPRVALRRRYPKMRMYGSDAALPLPWFTVKAEAAYFTQADDYLHYVVQLERNFGEWFLVGGYAGEAVTSRRTTLDFAPDRGLTRALLARAGYTIDVNRSIAFEAALRQNGDGLWTHLEYSHALGHHWRATAAFTWIRGAPTDFLGQYRRNSHATLALRYSF